ncbi:PhzF family phenazine biosynthesis protein [Bacillus sp. FJAT-52991]|uniref:PhzF family phenazine biosynthesis protein n=1 Tax=Bacillus kandeliae TaxID=3129297 RepID=A0ABZ2N4Q8_9BACI
MKTVTAFQFDAFSKEPNKGNPAGVVLDADHLTEEEMQGIAFKVGFNETAFTLPSDKADVQIRYFTPGHEMNLCGHGTIATIFSMITNGLLQGKDHLMIETKAGILPLKIDAPSKDEASITMKQAPAEFHEFQGSVDDLAASIGLEKNDIDMTLPIVYGSTGIWTLLLPIKTLSACQKMKPNNQRFPDVLKEMPKASIHPFCLETFDPNAQMHGRHFSSAFSGTIEDPVTGTASGVMGAYYAKYIEPKEQMKLLIEQGQEIGKDGRVLVSVLKKDNTFEVEITGQAVFVKKFEVSI